MYAGMCSVGVVLGGWPEFINIRTSSGRGQRKGCWLGTVEDPWDISKCRSTATPAQALKGKQKGKHASVPRWRWLEHGYGEVTLREQRVGGERRKTEDADVRCDGEERHAGRKYNKLLFGEWGQEQTHETDSWGLITRVNFYTYIYTHIKIWLTDTIQEFCTDPTG